tara:strand:- start:71 stop:460 length:390 start_codon:yes stop_codon:yes gene_type:complete
MTSTLKINTLTGVSTAGSIAVTGEGNSTTTNLQQGLLKSWVNFNGTGTIATRDSFNVTGLVDNGTGSYNVTIANDMANANFSVVSGGSGTEKMIGIDSHAASTFRTFNYADGSAEDATILSYSVAGDLA